MKLKDKIAVITGAGSGIGRATALLFSKEGAKVVVADIDELKAKETTQLIAENGGEAIYVKADVTRFKDWQNLVDTVIARYGRIDILHNNAGWYTFENVVEMVEETYDKILAINLKSTWLGCKLTIPHMIKGGGGTIVNTASILAFGAVPGSGAYGACHGGVIALTKAVAVENARYNIRANCTAAGVVATPMTMVNSTHLEPELAEIVEQYPLKRPAKPEEIAKTVLFLASEDSSDITGAVLTVDGGSTALGG
jgi:meso-butanediol dehydrogenase/(S,S)-butanediol dehydrogenase/diacetyl reductase